MIKKLIMIVGACTAITILMQCIGVDWGMVYTFIGFNAGIMSGLLIRKDLNG